MSTSRSSTETCGFATRRRGRGAARGLLGTWSEPGTTPLRARVVARADVNDQAPSTWARDASSGGSRATRPRGPGNTASSGVSVTVPSPHARLQHPPGLGPPRPGDERDREDDRQAEDGPQRLVPLRVLQVRAEDVDHRARRERADDQAEALRRGRQAGDRPALVRRHQLEEQAPERHHGAGDRDEEDRARGTTRATRPEAARQQAEAVDEARRT